MTTPPFTTPPTPPSRNDAAATFVSRANAFVAWMGTFFNEMVAAVTWLNTTAAEVEADRAAAQGAVVAADAAIAATDYAASTTATLTIGTGSTGSFSLAQLNKGFLVGDQVTLIRRTDEMVRMRGTVSAFNAATGAITVNVTKAPSGGGSAAGWFVVASALEGASPEFVTATAFAFAQLF